MPDGGASDARVARALVFDATALLRQAWRRAQLAGPEWPLEDSYTVTAALDETQRLSHLLTEGGTPVWAVLIHGDADDTMRRLVESIHGFYVETVNDDNARRGGLVGGIEDWELILEPDADVEGSVATTTRVPLATLTTVELF